MNNRFNVLILVLFLFLAGCSEKTTTKNSLSIGGSSSGLLILEPIVKAFNENNPKYKVTLLPGTETKDGLMGVSQGLLDIGLQARYLTDAEKKQYPNVQEVIFVKDALVIGTNLNVNVTMLTKEQIKQIYSGDITDWSQVGGGAGKIIVLDREESDSSKMLLRKEIFGSDLKVVSSAILLHSAGDMNKAIESTSNAIGPSSFGIINNNKLKINIVGIDGIYLSAGTIQNDQYTLVRTYGFTLPKGELDSLTKLFVDYVLSKESKNDLKSQGYIPIS